MKLSVIAFLLICCLSSYASAEVVIDQFYRPPYPEGWILDYPGDFAAQTFTVQHTGQITEVAVGVVKTIFGQAKVKPVTDDLYLRLVHTDANGVPVFSDVLASRTIDRNAVPYASTNEPLAAVDLSPFDIHVEAGEVLAIAISSNHVLNGELLPTYEEYEWRVGWERAPDSYPGGDFYVYSPHYYGPSPIIRQSLGNPRDGAFSVIIDTPEPASAPLGLIAFVGLAFLRTRTRI